MVSNAHIGIATHMNATTPDCEYTEASEFHRASRLIQFNRKSGDDMFKRMSRHPIKNALFQQRIPLSDTKYGANRMMPPEILHVSDAGLIIYMLESLQGMISGGRSGDELDAQHVRMLHVIRQQSERDFPCGAIRSGIIDSTRCQSSECRGNLFRMLCIAHTNDGELILKNELNLSPGHWTRWLQFLKLYLSMLAWFHSSVPKEEVRCAGPAVSSVLTSLQLYFPCQHESNGYCIPKMHGVAKMREYVSLYGSAMNFYGGPGEASHQVFVKAPGLKTQRRMSEFAMQTAGQYYNFLLVQKVLNDIDTNHGKRYIINNEENDNYFLIAIAETYLLAILILFHKN